MKISKSLNDALNGQLGHELVASHIYMSMAVYFNSLELKNLSAEFFRQSGEEREHALKFMHYMMEVGAEVEIPAIDKPQKDYTSVVEVFEKALEWEKVVTARINKMMDIAVADKDYASQGMLAWFIKEQVEEEASMSRFVTVAKALGEKNIFMLEGHVK
ncbi:MAG: ferritin [Anaerolineaceae bacterium]|nr:ferritin [Anaerolineaceae bacterium]